MLVMNPKLKGEHIIFRESMKKYESNDRALGVLKLSAPRSVYLNRPLISILEQLKVEPKVFLGMLMENLKSLANSLVCECSALTLFQNASSLCIPYEKLFSSGIPFLSEPIFRQIVDCLIPHRIKELKSKARIKVPMDSGRIAFGVLDETGSLDYGQIFAKLSHVNKDGFSSDKSFILEGEVMVTKFPCLHPGDVRKLTAVNIPALNHIKDCIVFPAKGPRPHSDEMAGSDLDGDEYALFWNCDLVFEGKNMEAMHFPTGNAEELDHNAEVADILDFYCNYILSNNVGLLANAHLANADFSEDGIFDTTCMSLAAKYAVALDFAKTGIVEPIQWSVFNQMLII
jgi:RNA-dependent RNA polymerase